jgi:hypothetical protein
MITEDYVSFNIAKLLKEKGFDEYCGYYSSDGEYWGYCTYNHKGKDYISAPTLQMAMKWLREVHHITIGITFSLGIITYEIQKDEEFITAIGSGRSYEDMVEEAIKCCLNLI